MLGYIRVFEEELKIKDFETYRSFYCGVCRDLKLNCGQISRITLNYDMTFLAVLLTSVYDKTPASENHTCMFHPLKKKRFYRNEYTSYAADMSLLLSYHNLMDDWIDEKKLKSRFITGILKSGYKKTALKYPRQNTAVEDYLTRLHAVERAGSDNLDEAANLTGEMLAEIFDVYENDIWSPDLRKTGYYLGKFIYLMDAYEDVEKDKQNNCYNPLIQISEKEDFDAKAKDILMLMAGGAASAFERLPAVEYIDILRNILYSGIWTVFGKINYGKVADERSV